MLHNKKARLVSEHYPEYRQEEEEELSHRASGSTQDNEDRILVALGRMEGSTERIVRTHEGMEIRLTRMEKFQRFLKKQGPAIKKFLGMKKKEKDLSSQQNEASTLEGIKIEEDEDNEDDEEEEEDEDEEEIEGPRDEEGDKERAMIYAFVEDEDDDDEEEESEEDGEDDKEEDEDEDEDDQMDDAESPKI